MINHVISSVLNCVPLDIELVSWDGNILTLSGIDWSFSTLSAWRVLDNASIEYACWDKDVEKKIKDFKGKKIINIDEQSSIVAVDPVFKLSSGKQLEIFTSETFEPWVLKLPNGNIFAGALESEHSDELIASVAYVN